MAEQSRNNFERDEAPHPVHADFRGIFQKISANNQAAQL